MARRIFRGRGNEGFAGGAWQVRARTSDGRWTAPPIRVAPKGADPVHIAVDIARDVLGGSALPGAGDGLVDTIALTSALASPRRPWIRPIHRWDPDAVRDVAEFVPRGSHLLLEDGVLTWRQEDNPHSLSAWHDDAFIAICVDADFEELEIVYHPTIPDEERAYHILAAQERDECFKPPHEELFDWEGYFGNNTLVVGGRVRFDLDADAWQPGYPPNSRKLSVALGGRSGVILGRVTHLAGRPLDRPDVDPSAPGRVHIREAEMPAVANAYPRLEADVATGPGPPVAVLVHGTFSCGMVIAESLFANFGAIGARRFEHDTFLPVAENAKHLVDLIETHLPRDAQILFVAHSRGGLVASLASALLGSRARVLSCGTPYRGTPLVTFGDRLTGLLAALGAPSGPTDLMSGHRESPADIATESFQYLLKARNLPYGVQVMTPGCGELLTIELATRDVERTTWGSALDPSAPDASGFLTGAKHGWSSTAFGGEPNDLVVPTASANPGANGQWALSGPSHSQYFGHPEVVASIAAHLNISH